MIQSGSWKLLKRVIGGLWFFFWLVSGSGRATLLEDIPLDSWVYPAIDELLGRGFLSGLMVSDRPYSRGDIAKELVKIRDQHDLTGSRRWLLQRLYIEFANEMAELSGVPGNDRLLNLRSGVQASGSNFSTGKGVPVQRGKFDYYLGVELDRYLMARTRARVDTRGQFDSSVHARTWKNNLTGLFDDSYIKFHTKYLDFFWGRQFIQWAFGDGDALLLSDQSPPFDQFKLKARYRSLQYQFLAARLDPISDSLGQLLPRFFSGHRLNWKLKTWLELSVSEVVLYGGPGRTFELYYLNPLVLFYGEQFNNRDDDNPLLSCDVVFSGVKNLTLFGEFLVDDFQYDLKSEPQQIGFRLGFLATDFLGKGKSVGRLEYTRVNTFVYGQNRLWNIYTHFNTGIGSDIGPDADRWRASLLYRPRPDLDLVFSGQFLRRGEDRIQKRQSGLVPYLPKFPSGVVEKSTSLALSARYQYRAYVFGEISLGGTFLRNIENKSASHQDDYFVRGALTINWWLNRRY